MAHFTSAQMTTNYLYKYEMVMNGQQLNKEVPILTSMQIEKFLPFLP
jgi:hypothetical protein